MKILIADKFGPELTDLLSKHGEVFVADDSAVPEADVILVRSKTKVRGDYLARAKNLKLVIRGGVGIDNIDTDECARRGIFVRNTPAASSIAVAEMVFALMLGAVRHIPAADAGTKAGQWPKKQLKGSELFGKTLGLLGLGRIGVEVATRAQAFGMRVLATDLVVKISDWAEMVDMNTLLAQSDFLSLHIPATPATIGLIDDAAIARMKPGAILINTARGAVVDTEALVSALEAGKLHDAALDVFPEEPVPADSPLLKAPKILVTPHLSSSTDENMTRIGVIAEQLISDFAAGKLTK